MMKHRLSALILAAALLAAPLSAPAENSRSLPVSVTQSKNGKTETRTWLDDAGNPVSPDRTAAVRLTYTLSGGTVTRAAYEDASGRTVDGPDGWAVCETTVKNGLVTETSYLDENGAPAPGPEGWATETREYSKKKLRHVRRFGAGGEPFDSPAVCAHEELTWALRDGERVLVRVDDYAADGAPVNGPDGYASAVYDYAGSKVASVSFFGADGQPAVSRSLGYARVDYRFDGSRSMGVSYTGADGEPVAGPDGWASVDYNRGERDADPVREMYYAADGSPFELPGGWCAALRTYNKKGQLVRELYLGRDGEPRLSTEGVGGRALAYAGGKVSSVTWLDTEGKPMTHPALGYVTAEYDYQGTGLKRITCLDENGRQVNNADGWSKEVYSFDRKLVSAVRWYDLDGKPVDRLQDGVAAVEYTHSKSGEVTSTVWKNAAGEQVTPAANLGAGEKRVSSAEGSVSESWFTNGEPVLNSEGYHRVERTLNIDGEPLDEVFYGLDGEAAVTAGGYASIRRVYAADGSSVSARYCGADGKPVARTDGVAEVQTDLDAEGRPIEERYYGLDGRAAADADGAVTVRWRYTEDGEAVRTAFDLSGAPVE